MRGFQGDYEFVWYAIGESAEREIGRVMMFSVGNVAETQRIKTYEESYVGRCTKNVRR